MCYNNPMPFKIERNDITKVHTDAIVNTANPMPVVGAGTDEAVYNAAGLERLLKDREKIGDIARGAAAYTPAYNLFDTNGIRYIIHTVGIHWDDGEHGETEIMRNCYRNSLKIAKELGCESVSIPLLATGFYGFPKETALNIALDEISKFLFETEMEVTLVVYDKESFCVSNKIFEGVKSFIDENYVEERKNPYDDVDDIVDREIRRQRSDEKIPDKSISISIDDYMSQNKGGLNFQDLLLKYEKEKGMEDVDVYTKSSIVDRKLFSKIRNGHIPSKHYVMALGLALELDLNSFEAFLASANYALNPADKFDLVVKYCITKKIYDITKVDALLFQMDLPCFVKDD